MQTFVDSSAWIALAVGGDANHKAAVAWRGALRPGDTLVTSDYVFDETVTRLLKLGGHPAAVTAGDAIRTSPLVRMLHVEKADFDAAWKLFTKYRTQGLSFTDCTIRAQMQRLGIKRLCTFDGGFAKIGVDVVP